MVSLGAGDQEYWYSGLISLQQAMESNIGQLDASHEFLSWIISPWGCISNNGPAGQKQTTIEQWRRLWTGQEVVSKLQSCTAWHISTESMNVN